MKYIHYYFIIISSLLVSSCSIKTEVLEADDHQIPSGVLAYENTENNPTLKDNKKKYLDEVYSSDDGRNIDSIIFHQAQGRRQQKGASSRRANTSILGQWYERGPNNESGDIREVDFDPIDNSLYIVSNPGHIWKGNLDKRKWEVLNDKIKFSNNILKQVNKNGVSRIISIYGTDNKDNKVPRYSDDNGQTWTKSREIENFFHDGWGSPKKMYKLSDNKTLYYFVHTWKSTPWGSAFELYKSTDYGTSWQIALSLNGGAYNNGNNVNIAKAPDSDEIYLIDKVTKTMHIVSHNFTDGTSSVTEKEMRGQTIPSGEFLLTLKMKNNQPTFYGISEKKDIYIGNYSGSNIKWALNGSIADNGGGNIFRKGWMANPDTDQLFAGGFQVYTSTDEGNSFTDKYVQWWEYYKVKNSVQQQDSMHVDIMHIEYFKKSDNTPFIIVLNHAGIHVTYDNMSSTENLGLDGLNIVTLYDQETADDGTIYFGAQDKGTFRHLSDVNNNTDIVSSQNFSTGDGMRSLFFNNGQSWFGFLQNGFMYCNYDKSAGNKKGWDVPGNNTTGWINPIAHYHDPSAKKCYIAGGDLNANDANGLDGCHLITMEVSWTGNGDNFQWLPTQFDYDFRANSNSGSAVIRSISATELDGNRIYVATTDATFFYTTDGGNSWSKSNTTLPSSLTAFDIQVSNSNKDILYVSGNGFSNPAVYKSIDGGQTFTAIDNGIPEATFESIALSSDDKHLFGASTSGPYVYDVENDIWEDLSDGNTPTVRHNSVKFIESEQIVRFGTYGRGVWDFVIDQTITGLENSSESLKANIYPNPASGQELTINAIDAQNIKFYSLKGELIKAVSLNKQQSKVSIEEMEKGIYLTRIQHADGSYSSDKLIIE